MSASALNEIEQPLIHILQQLNRDQLIETLAYIAGIGSRDDLRHVNALALDLALSILPPTEVTL